jgi:hypothetical protein
VSLRFHRRLTRRILDRWWETPLDVFTRKVKPIVVGNNEIKAPFRSLKSYDSHRRNMCKQLHMDEVFAPRAMAEAVVNTGNKQTRVCYDQSGICHEISELNFTVRQGVKIKPNMIYCSESAKRRSRMVYLSHVLAQCGLREKAIRPLWRLLRVGYTIRYTNFSKLVDKVARLCNIRFDFTRNLTAPAKGLRFIPRFIRDAQPLVVKGIYVPRWTYNPVYTGDFESLKLD